MEMNYSKRLSPLYAICLNETRGNDGIRPSSNLEDYDALEAATYLTCYITFKAIHQAERSPVDERVENFDMLSVYQAYAMLLYACLTLPLGEEGIAPALDQASVTIAKSLFAELSVEELAEIVESDNHKFQLIGDAEAEHWMNYREDIDKAAIAFVVAGTDENSPYDKEEPVPLFGALLSMLCEAFASD